MKKQSNISRTAPPALATQGRDDELRGAEEKQQGPPSRRRLWKKVRYALYLLVLLVPLFYLALQLHSIYLRPYRTQTAIEVTLTDAVSVKGVVVRNETPVTSAGQGVVGYLTEDGVRVSAGTQVAALYADAQSAAGSERSKELGEKIASLKNAQAAPNTSADLESITKKQQTNLYALLAVLEEKDYSTLQDTVLALTESVDRMQIATGRATSYEDLISRLQQQKNEWDQISQPVELCTAPQSGFFISETDGYETAFSPQEALQWDVQQVMEAAEGGISPQPSPQTIGKIVTDYKWYFICVMDKKDAERYESMAGTYDKVELIFHSSAQLEIPAYVQSVTAEGEEKAKVVLRAETMNAQAAALRFEQADVSIRTVTGLRIDKEALHVENGEYGVYVKRGGVAQYRRITPIFENEQYVLVPVTPNEEKTGINEVEMFDEIIVEGKDLYDGKLL